MQGVSNGLPAKPLWATGAFENYSLHWNVPETGACGVWRAQESGKN